MVLQLPCLDSVIGLLQGCGHSLACTVQAGKLMHAMLQVEMRASDPEAQQQMPALPAKYTTDALNPPDTAATIHTDAHQHLGHKAGTKLTTN